VIATMMRYINPFPSNRAAAKRSPRLRQFPRRFARAAVLQDDLHRRGGAPEGISVATGPTTSRCQFRVRAVDGAFSNVRHQLGRCDDEPWYRHAFSDTDFGEGVTPRPPFNFGPRHRD
jgi:hypothetical protein